MIRIAHVAKLASTGNWQAYADAGRGVEAVFHAPTRLQVVTEAVNWIGQGDPLKTLEMAQDALSETLEKLRG